MADNFKEIFISYAWGGESEDLVNKLDATFQTRGITIIRDKRELGFKGRIKAFMEKIGRGKAVIVVISEKYLKSENCMFELVQIAKNEQFYDRIFPIVLSDANIYKPAQRIKYVQYWEQKIKELDDAMKTVAASNLQGFREEIDLYVEIRSIIAGLANILKDMNALTPDIHIESDFEALFQAIQGQISDSHDPASNQPTTGTVSTPPQFNSLQPTNATRSLEDISTTNSSNASSKPIPPSQSNDVSSERFGASYYAHLRELLKAGMWKEADQETADRMYEVMGRQKEGWLRAEDIQNFPCHDLRNIDQLWVNFSGGKFGFSVQRKIWLECGSPRDYNANWERFGNRVGWRKDRPYGRDWIVYNEVTFNQSAALPGHLPVRVVGTWSSGWRGLLGLVGAPNVDELWFRVGQCGGRR